MFDDIIETTGSSTTADCVDCDVGKYSNETGTSVYCFYMIMCVEEEIPVQVGIIRVEETKLSLSLLFVSVYIFICVYSVP